MLVIASAHADPTLVVVELMVLAATSKLACVHETQRSVELHVMLSSACFT